MGAIYDVIKAFFTEDEWPMRELDDQTALNTGFSGDNGQWNCRARADETREQFLFYSYAPKHAPYEVRQLMAEFLTRANYGLLIGNFEMDFNDGEVRYKTSIDVENDRLTVALVKSLVYANVLTMDRYLPGIEAVIDGQFTPAQAIRMVEGDRSGGENPSRPVEGHNDQIEA